MFMIEYMLHHCQYVRMLFSLTSPATEGVQLHDVKDGQTLPYIPGYHTQGAIASTIFFFIVPHFRESARTLNLICPSVSPSVCHKNFNLGHNFCTITSRALILGMCVLCDITFPTVPCRDLDHDLLQGQICCQARDQNSLNLLVYISSLLAE